MLMDTLATYCCYKNSSVGSTGSVVASTEAHGHWSPYWATRSRSGPLVPSSRFQPTHQALPEGFGGQPPNCSTALTRVTLYSTLSLKSHVDASKVDLSTLGSCGCCQLQAHYLDVNTPLKLRLAPTRSHAHLATSHATAHVHLAYLGRRPPRSVQLQCAAQSEHGPSSGWFTPNSCPHHRRPAATSLPRTPPSPHRDSTTRHRRTSKPVLRAC